MRDVADVPSLLESALDTAAPSWDDGEPLIEITGVSKKYCRDFRRSLRYAALDVARGMVGRSAPPTLRPEEFWAVRDVSFVVRRGDSLGVIGHNGAGKSTLLRMLTGQRQLTSGTVITRGRVVPLAELTLGFDPVLSGRENAYVNAAVHGVSRAQMDALIDPIIDFAGIREFIDSAVQTYSAGMKVRLGFAVGTHLQPDILVIDEVLAVGDMDFRRKCVSHVQGFLRAGGSLVLVAHDPYLVQTMCNRCVVMERGRIIFEGSGVDGVNVHFRLGHTATMKAATGGAASEAPADADMTGDGQTTARNWITEFVNTPAGSNPTPGHAAPFRPEPSAEHPVVVTAIEVAGENGASLVTGATAIVTMRCQSLVEMHVGWGFSFLTGDLHTVIATNALGLDSAGVMMHPGANVLRCRIPHLPFRPGVYATRGGVSDVATQVPLSLLGYRDSPTFFTVTNDGANRTGNLQSISRDLVAIPVEWLSSG